MKQTKKKNEITASNVTVNQPHPIIVLPSESLEQYQALVQKLEQDFQAATIAEKILIEKMAQSLWRKQRLHMVESQILITQSAKQQMEIEAVMSERTQSRRIVNLKAEIRTLERCIEDLTYEIESGERINRLRNKGRFQEEAVDWILQNIKALLKTDEILERFLTREEREDSCEEWVRKTEGGEYSRRRWAAKTSLQITYEWKKETETIEKENIQRPLCLYSLESYRNELKKWLAKRKQELKGLFQQLEVEKQHQLACSTLMLDDSQTFKIQKTESYLDAQYFKAQEELQRLQAFMFKKTEMQKAITAHNAQGREPESLTDNSATKPIE